MKELPTTKALDLVHAGKVIEVGIGDELYVTIKDLTTLHGEDLSEICGGRYEVSTNVPIVNRWNYSVFDNAFEHFNQIRQVVIDRASDYQIL